MHTPRVSSATLRITRGRFSAYRVVYLISYIHGGAIITGKIYGQANLRAFLNDLAIPANEIDIITVVVEARISYDLRLAHLDKDTVASVLLRYADA